MNLSSGVFSGAGEAVGGGAGGGILWGAQRQ